MSTDLDPTPTDNMKTEAEFIAQAQCAKEALDLFIKITGGKEYDNADLIKRGAMVNLMTHTVCIFHNFLCIFCLVWDFL